MTKLKSEENGKLREKSSSPESKVPSSASVKTSDASPIVRNETLPPSFIITSDDAYGHSSSKKRRRHLRPWLSWLASLVRVLLLDIPLLVLFTLYVGTVVVHQIHDDYLVKQLQLMRFIPDDRDYVDTTYYHRICDSSDVSATSVDELVLPVNATADDALTHMMTHGATLYPNLLSPETAGALREFIDRENKVREGYYVIENHKRWSWGIHIDDDESIRRYWKELASNKRLVEALERIVGPDPAVIEFTAITSAYGAKDQFDHQDVVSPASGVKYARTFIPSYSLFITLQDTTYEMGATQVCPGSHLCSEGCEEFCPKHDIPMSGDDGGVWKQGWGALLNQQTTHKGMGHTDPNAMDRVVIICTFAPRPQLQKLETRMIGQGGSYSLLWSQWGHTLRDFASEPHATFKLWKTMKEPWITMRCFGLLKAKGWNGISVASMRIANEDTGYTQDTLDGFVEEGGFKFLPKIWQGASGDGWHLFLFHTLKLTEEGLKQANSLVLVAYLVLLVLISIIFRSKRTLLRKSVGRLVVTYGMIVLLAMYTLRHVENTSWAKNICSGRAYRLPKIDDDPHRAPATLPTKEDVLIAPHYVSDFLAGYGRVLDYGHPGNRRWKNLTEQHATGYEQLTPSMQRELSASIALWVQEESRRFLFHNQVREWAHVTDMSALTQLCHRELLMASDTLTEALARQLDSLKAETVWGRWNNMAIHRTIIPAHLRSWEKRIVPPLASKTTGQARLKISSPAIFTALANTVPSTDVSLVRTRGLPASPRLLQEPHPLAWLSEGDTVEGMYKCQFNQWYRGTVTEVFSAKNTFDVTYEDGEEDEDLTLSCIRPFVPFHVGETVEVIFEDIFYRGRIVEAYPGDVFDIKTQEAGLQKLVAPRYMRRFVEAKAVVFERGDLIEARFNGGDRWFEGKIAKLRNGSYDISYSDGDFEKAVSPELMRLAQT